MDDKYLISLLSFNNIYLKKGRYIEPIRRSLVPFINFVESPLITLNCAGFERR